MSRYIGVSEEHLDKLFEWSDDSTVTWVASWVREWLEQVPGYFTFVAAPEIAGDGPVVVQDARWAAGGSTTTDKPPRATGGVVDVHVTTDSGRRVVYEVAREERKPPRPTQDDRELVAPAKGPYLTGCPLCTPKGGTDYTTVVIEGNTFRGTPSPWPAPSPGTHESDLPGHVHVEKKHLRFDGFNVDGQMRGGCAEYEKARAWSVSRKEPQP